MSMKTIDDLPERIRKKIKVCENGCWEWIGARTSDGYGHIQWQGRKVTAHRFVRHFLVGDVSIFSKGRSIDSIDHLCEVRYCVNPDHLEPVTHRENIRRAHEWITHCPQGHPYSGENLRIASNGTRRCVECQRIANRSSYYKRRARSA